MSGTLRLMVMTPEVTAMLVRAAQALEASNQAVCPNGNFLQTAICTTIFYGWGLGLWGQVGPAAGLLLALTVFFAIQVPWSIWWLNRNDRGPMEQLWAWMTYGSRNARVDARAT